ncbi:unnamed protein product [Prorocentrum cordatum]|uniref:Uncharacterized protein n=1 Tax=Prorocentrum cordatum TaxID=2364126 RepID=A0ABN9V2I8_9DINO|nr:unnamed protein product [Polarella glacialis]
MHFSVPGLIHLPSAQVRRPEAGPLLLLGLRKRPGSGLLSGDRQGTPLGDEQPVPGKGPQGPGSGGSSRSGRRRLAPSPPRQFSRLPLARRPFSPTRSGVRPRARAPSRGQQPLAGAAGGEDTVLHCPRAQGGGSTASRLPTRLV